MPYAQSLAAVAGAVCQLQITLEIGHQPGPLFCVPCEAKPCLPTDASRSVSAAVAVAVTAAAILCAGTSLAAADTAACTYDYGHSHSHSCSCRYNWTERPQSPAQSPGLRAAKQPTVEPILPPIQSVGMRTCILC